LCDGDARVQAELLGQLRASNDKDAAVLRDAFAARDLPQVARAAHRMHGAAVFVGATALAEVCRTLADAGRESDAAVAEATLPRFNAELSRLNTFLERDE
jgi:HPt (histidine-containing phosphotransfer) domain-containing protein